MGISKTISLFKIFNYNRHTVYDNNSPTKCTIKESTRVVYSVLATNFFNKPFYSHNNRNLSFTIKCNYLLIKLNAERNTTVYIIRFLRKKN